MPFYLESQDGSQGYKASLFSSKRDLIESKIYTLEDLGFCDLLCITSQNKPPQKKLIAKWYGPKYSRLYRYLYAIKCLRICPKGEKINTALWALRIWG